MSNFNQTGPDLLPLGSIDQLAMPAKGLSILEDQAYETATFDDDSDHDLCLLEVLPGRTTSVQYRVTAHDDAGSRTATGIGDMAYVDFGGGGAGLEGIFGSGSYDGDGPPPLGGAPWNMLTATAVVIDPTHVVVRVNGLAGVTIRWTVWAGAFGAQAR